MVRIAICEGLWGKVSIIQCGTQKKLWEGKSRDLAEFALPDGLQEAAGRRVSGRQRGDHRTEPLSERAVQVALLPDGAELLVDEGLPEPGVLRGSHERGVP